MPRASPNHPPNMQKKQYVYNTKSRINITKYSIDIENLRYKSPEGITILDNVNIKISEGEKVGVVGFSGTGKSTLLKLILKLIEPCKGNIYIGEHNIKKLDVDYLRSKIGFMQQEPALFNESIINNIRLAKPDATDQEVKAAASKANCDEFLEQLPMGIHTIIGNSGNKLSGGQKQRLALARLLLKDAPIILLDEATSALDSITEKKVQDVLNTFAVNKTVISVAHKLKTLKNMDRLILIEKDKISTGTFAKLSRENSKFKQMLVLQNITSTGN